jgi:3-hydroxyacyl-CoA dehydrogenase/3-hydroxy-2-methylbutyryl-CoA dehydrogenase
MRVSGAVGLVTGGASGLGEGVVRMLVDGGGKAVILDRAGSRGDQIADELGPAATFVACDITDPGQVESAVATAADAYGRVDVLVSSAGISPAARLVARRLPSRDRGQPGRAVRRPPSRRRRDDAQRTR